MKRVTHYAELIGAIKARMDELGVTYETLDAVAGLQNGYCAKFLAEPDPNHPKKRLGPFTMFLVLQALGLELNVAHDPQQLENVRRRLEKRKVTRVRAAARIVYFTPDHMRKIAVKGGETRWANVKPRHRSILARRAIRVRWAKRDACCATHESGRK